MRIRIIALLLAALGSVGLLSIGTTVFAWVSVQREAQQLGTLKAKVLQPLQDLKALSDAYAVSVVDASHKVRNGGFRWEEGQAALADARRVITRAWANVQAMPFAPEPAALLVTARARKGEADSVLVALEQTMASRDAALLDALVRERLYPAIDPLTETIGALTDELVATATASTDETAADAEVTLLWLGALALAALLLLAAAAWLVVLRVTRPIADLTGAIGRLAGGELARTIPHVGRGDEVGDMARAVIVLQGGLQEADAARADAAAARVEAERARAKALVDMADRVERETRSAVDEVALHMDRMSAEAEAMAGPAETVASESTSVSTAAEEARRNVQSVAAAAEELGASIREIVQQIAGATAATRRAADRGTEGRARIAALAEEVERIGGVARVIADIAAQTNLLALNATIEAARAGEAGKGFAVVAGEVKALAAQTARATEEISRQVQEMTAATGRAVEVVREVADSVAHVDEVATAIAAAMEQQSAATQEIARAVAETSAATDEVSRRMAAVSGETQQTGRRAEQVQQGTGTARGAVAELRRVIVRVVRAAAPEVERRTGSRGGAGLPVSIEAPGQSAILNGRLADLSAGGAAVEGPLPGLRVGATPTLRFQDGAVPPLRTRILSIEEDGKVRLVFEPPLAGAARDALARLIAREEGQRAAA